MVHSVHFTGVGGVGMSGLAHICLERGCAVSGSDLVASKNFDALCARGMTGVVGHFETLPEEVELLVYSSAVPESDTERQQALRRGIPQMRRGDFLSYLAQGFQQRVAVSGSHGKTTTTAMLVHILQENGKNPGYMIGGTVNGWDLSAKAGDGKLLVTEVDESDGSQASFPATMALVMNIDDDHSWALGGTEGLDHIFAGLCSNASEILTWQGEGTERVLGGNPSAHFYTEVLAFKGQFPWAGWHNDINATLAVEAATRLGVERNQAFEALKSFPGVSRRMSERGRSADGKHVLLEDYAHHPTELKATIDALREAYPDHRLLLLFQPHRLERVERYGRRFAELLDTVEWCCLVEPFGAWRVDGKTVDPQQYIAAFMKKPCVCLPNLPEKVVDKVCAEWLSPQKSVLAVIGAGDVNRLLPYFSERL